MAIEAITFEENGWLRELTTHADYVRAIADGRLTPDTQVQCYDASGTFTTARAGDVELLKPIFADPTGPEIAAEPEPGPAPIAPTPRPAPAPPIAVAPVPVPPPASASGAPITAAPSIPMPPTPAPPPVQPQVVLPGDPRVVWPPQGFPPPPPTRRKKRGCGCVTWAILLLVTFVALFAVLKLAPWNHVGSSRSTAAYTALGPAATFYITRSTNLRSEPDIGHDPVGRLTRGTRITGTRVRSRAGEEYVRVEGSGSAERFVWGYNVAADPPPDLDTSAAGTRRLERGVDVLARPAPGAAVLERRLAGRQIQLTGTVGDGAWGEMLLDHGVGYVAMSDLAGDQPGDVVEEDAE